MTCIALCGPHGAKISEFIQLIKKNLGEKKLTCIDADTFWRDNELDEQALQSAIEATSGDVMLYGHYVLSNDAARSHCDTLLFIETAQDTGLAHYLKGFRHLDQEGQFKQLSHYLDTLKKENDETINPSGKHAHILINTCNDVSAKLIANHIKAPTPRKTVEPTSKYNPSFM